MTKFYSMNKISTLLVTVLTLSSCAGSYNIQGSSNVSDLDGQKLYLKVPKGDAMVNLDSCDVVHGQFTFNGNTDSARIAHIYMDDKNLMVPIVVEKGDITVKLDNSVQKISGTPLNDKISEFWNRFLQIQYQYADLDHEQSASLLNGQDEAEVNQRLVKRALTIFSKYDKMFTKFVTDNYNNVLGPWAFLTRVSYDSAPGLYPAWMSDYMLMNALNQLPSWIEYIMVKAPDSFKNDPDVKEFYTQFQEWQRKNSGMETTPATPIPSTSVGDAPAPPTPNDMASDSVQ